MGWGWNMKTCRSRTAPRSLISRRASARRYPCYRQRRLGVKVDIAITGHDDLAQHGIIARIDS